MERALAVKPITMMQEISTNEILSLFDITKEQQQSFCHDLIERIKEGNAYALKVHLQIKSMSDIIKQITDDAGYKKIVLSDAESYGKKSFDFLNGKFEIKETGVKYDYSQCNDPVLIDLEFRANELNEQVKQRQAFLKSVPASGVSILIEETGESVTVYPPSKSSTTSVAVTLK